MSDAPIRRLAQEYGLICTYQDGLSRRQVVFPETMVAVLRLLGAHLKNASGAAEALRQRRLSFWSQVLEPVTVVWEGEPVVLSLRLPLKEAQGRLSTQLMPEEGPARCHRFDLARLPVVRASEVEGVSYAVKRIKLPGRLPWGYHRFALEWKGRLWTSWIFSAPLNVYSPGERADRTWGLFVPAYALHSRRSWGAGDFSDLKRFVRWTAGCGAQVAGFLPFLASFLEDPFDPSPYAPASRLFWNEFFIDPSQVPEFKRSAAARQRWGLPALQNQIDRFRRSSHVDYRKQMALKRQLLEIMARSLWKGGSGRRMQFRRFIKENPPLNDYAQFRAAVEHKRVPWTRWPEPMREGRIQPGDYDEQARRYHMYVQWIASEQVKSLRQTAQAARVKLYLDFPLGVHPFGYDVWRERNSFAVGASAGAPPDLLFRQGQRWGFPPLHPQRLRADGYRYFIAALRHSMAQAPVVRLDHVMGFHRLFWIPKGMSAKEGLYVRYRPEEFYAILSIESRRHKTVLVGEDLGTVPKAVRLEMNRHRVKRTYVLQLEARPHGPRPLPPPPRGSLACLNTHDTQPFAAFLRTQKVTCQALEQIFQTSPSNLLRACLVYLRRSPAWLVCVSLEDLWGETQSQNVPGKLKRRSYWRRKARYSLEEFSNMPGVLKLLQELRRCRR